MAFKATKQQEKAIFEKGNILVSAAAGSGKTAVLVERVISILKDKTSNISADELLIVTFTNAAAAEMRSRIEKRLDEECKKNPLDTGLLLQKHLLSNAKICTIDSFCIDLVRENFDKLDISPDFSIADAYSLKEIDQNVIYGIINRYLEANDPVFHELLDIIGAEFDEGNFAEAVLSIYEYSRQMPFPYDWFDALLNQYSNGDFSKENIWYKLAFEKAEKVLLSMQNLIANCIDLISSSQKAVDAYLGVFSDFAKQIVNLIDAAKTSDWNTFYNSLCEFKPLSLPIVRGLSGMEDITAAKETYKYLCEKPIEELEKIFYGDFEFIDFQFKKLNKPIALLVEILKEFDSKVFEEYKQSNKFTFHNTEHLALKLLCKSENGKITVNPESTELLSRFKEVMVDEYQDTNDLQDMLFYVLSNFEKNLFAVGDVKQSIYAFRGANPSNFLNKKNRYIDIEKAAADDSKKIILGNNFRTKSEVCDYINFFFTLFMQKETGDIDYTNDEQLIPSAVYPETNTPCVSFDIIDTAASQENALILEARHIAKIIKDTVEGGECIRLDDNTLRKAKYSDFTILLRSMSNKAPEIVEELKRHNIPINLSLESFAGTLEISTFLALLKVIDNPQSDVELLTLMLSPIFNFTPDELALIRSQKKDGNLYSAVIFVSQNGDNKCENFLKTLEVYRLYSVTNSLPKLISKLLSETEYLNMVSAMQDGERRKNNLLLLCDYATQYSQGNICSIGGFVKFINNQTSSLKSAISSAQTNAVNIMSIHASKGLQFPVCIIASIASHFNDQESRESCVYDTNLGLGFRYFDEDDKTKYNTISRQIILDSRKKTSLEEELRLFYVALTRTQDKLYMVSSVKNIEKTVDKYKTMLIASNNKIDYSVISRTKSYFDWLVLSSLLHPNGKMLRGNGIIPIETESQLNINIINSETLFEATKVTKTDEINIDFDVADEIKENLSYSYPYSEILNIESKTSVSAIANKAESDNYLFTNKPAFLSSDGISPTGRGTAMHKVMQFFDFEKCDDIDSEIERLYEWQFISEVEMNSLDRVALKNFFNSDIFKRIKNSPLVKKEMRFLTEVAATKINPNLDKIYENENVIIQGAVDICFVEDDGLVILDFKTDRVDDITDLKDAYSEQLSIYALACEKIFERQVKEKIIYSFKFSDTIKI